MFKAWVIIGTNLGDKAKNLNGAVEFLSVYAGKINRLSSVYNSEAWGYQDTNYYNQVAEISTLLSPEKLLETVLLIEKKMGRVRNNLVKYEARIIDIDILFYENITLSTKNLIIPHGKISERKFVLMPLEEVIPNYIHPKLKISISDLLAMTPDTLTVKKI